MNTPKVSIIMPSLNVGPFIRECIESAVNQTLTDIEILCVDAGSTDGTAEILQEYAAKDSRVHFIHSDVRSYGYQMNLGLDAATGEYIGILETDDWTEPDQFEKMYAAAKEQDADLVKSNYYWYYTKEGVRNEPFENLKKCPYETVFCPMENRALFNVTPSIWSGIYRRQMLLDNGIRFNETPGASFQDTSFHFMLCTVAKRVYLLKEHYLHYRKDNDGSSVHSASKVFCLADEMHYYEAFLEKHPEEKAQLMPFWQALKYEKYRWNYDRLSPQHQYSFLKLMHREFSAAKQAGLLDQSNFAPLAWKNVNIVSDNPVQYFRESQAKRSAKQGYLEQVEPVVLQKATCPDPTISVIIPVFNVEQYLAECLDSILSQGIENLEVICVNDGSMDTSLELVQKYAKDDPRFTVVDQINAGQSVARNIGISLARGEYLYFMDSDDYLVPGALNKLLTTARMECTDIVYFGAESFFEDRDLKLDHANYVNFYKRQPTFDHAVSGDVLLMDQLENWLFRCSIPLQFIRREFLLDTGLRFKEGIIHEDELISCLLAAKSQRSLCIADSLYMRRVRANSTMTAVYTAGKFIGFFIVATTLMSFAVSDSTLTKTGREAVLFHANKILRDAKNTYRNLPESEKDKIVEMLPVEYQPYFFEMCNSFEGNYNDFIAIKKSMSYRIGLMVTFLPRKMMRGVKCVRDHGFGYTVGHVFRKGFLMVAKVFRRKPGKKLNPKGFFKCVSDHGLGYTIKLGLKKLTRR